MEYKDDDNNDGEELYGNYQVEKITNMINHLRDRGISTVKGLPNERTDSPAQEGAGVNHLTGQRQIDQQEKSQVRPSTGNYKQRNPAEVKQDYSFHRNLNDDYKSAQMTQTNQFVHQNIQNVPSNEFPNTLPQSRPYMNHNMLPQYIPSFNSNNFPGQHPMRTDIMSTQSSLTSQHNYPLPYNNRPPSQGFINKEKEYRFPSNVLPPQRFTLPSNIASQPSSQILANTMTNYQQPNIMSQNQPRMSHQNDLVHRYPSQYPSITPNPNNQLFLANNLRQIQPDYPINNIPKTFLHSDFLNPRLPIARENNPQTMNWEPQTQRMNFHQLNPLDINRHSSEFPKNKPTDLSIPRPSFPPQRFTTPSNPRMNSPTQSRQGVVLPYSTIQQSNSPRLPIVPRQNLPNNRHPMGRQNTTAWPHATNQFPRAMQPSFLPMNNPSMRNSYATPAMQNTFTEQFRPKMTHQNFPQSPSVPDEDDLYMDPDDPESMNQDEDAYEFIEESGNNVETVPISGSGKINCRQGSEDMKTSQKFSNIEHPTGQRQNYNYVTKPLNSKQPTPAHHHMPPSPSSQNPGPRYPLQIDMNINQSRSNKEQFSKRQDQTHGASYQNESQQMTNNQSNPSNSTQSNIFGAKITSLKGTSIDPRPMFNKIFPIQKLFASSQPNRSHTNDNDAIDDESEDEYEEALPPPIAKTGRGTNTPKHPISESQPLLNPFQTTSNILTKKITPPNRLPEKHREVPSQTLGHHLTENLSPFRQYCRSWDNEKFFFQNGNIKLLIEDGLFMIRPSTTRSNGVTLCVRNGNCVLKFPVVMESNNMFHIESETEQFSSIQELIAAKQSCPIILGDGTKVILTHPPLKP